MVKKYVVANKNMVINQAGVVIATCLNEVYAGQICDLMNWCSEMLVRQPWGERYNSRDIHKMMEVSLCNTESKAPKRSTLPALPKPLTAASNALPALPALPTSPASPGPACAPPLPVRAAPPPLPGSVSS